MLKKRRQTLTNLGKKVAPRRDREGRHPRQRRVLPPHRVFVFGRWSVVAGVGVARPLVRRRACEEPQKRRLVQRRRHLRVRRRRHRVLPRKHLRRTRFSQRGRDAAAAAGGERQRRGRASRRRGRPAGIAVAVDGFKERVASGVADSVHFREVGRREKPARKGERKRER